MAQLTNKDLESLLRPKFGNDLVVESFTSSLLTAPGENFGSTMLALEVRILRGKKEKSQQNLSLVAKLAPTSDFLKRLFDIENTFYKEIMCYIEVRELYDEIQQEMGISEDKYFDIFPICYGARTTLSSEIGDAADENVVLLLENLKASHYDIVDRRKGLDFKHMKFTVLQLARFHAISVVIKLRKPQEFQKKIMKACKIYNVGISKEECEQHNQTVLQNVSSIPECKNYIERLKKRTEVSTKTFLENLPEKASEPYASLTHLDFWSNNMMFSYDSNREPVKMKFLDFQGVKYSSPARDLIFLLYSSAADGVMPKHYDEFIQIYHEHFISCLNDFGCDVTPFTLESFLAEINEVAPKEVSHIMFMLTFICADKKDTVTDMAQVETDNLVSKSNPIYEKRAKVAILDFVKKGWL